MLIDLEQPLVGNFVCTVLISCENWMDHTWMRGGPNVDVNFVYFVGKNISLDEIMQREETPEEDNGVVNLEANDVGDGGPSTEVVDSGDPGLDELVSKLDRIWFGSKE